jgi:ABC-2 type transport system ATP-binding protein
MRLTATGLSKKWDEDVWGIRDVSFDFGPGVTGLLGPNGAGKSTLLRLVATLTQPTAGTLCWNGTDVAEHPSAVRRVLGYLPQNFGGPPELTAREFLQYLAALRGLPRGLAHERIDALLGTVRLAPDQRLGAMSGGTKQRVGIAQALLNDPALLVVDEPTVGLDPKERARFRSLLTDLAQDRVVLFSTHIVSDVEAAATHLAVMEGGRLVASTTPEALLDRVRNRVWEWVVEPSALDSVRSRYPVTQTARRPQGVRVHAVAGERPQDTASAADPTLEDAYLALLSSRRGDE